MMWMPAWTIRIVWPGSSPSPDRAVDRSHARLSAPTAIRPARGQPARAVGGHPAGGFERGGISPQRARAEPDQHHVARAELDASAAGSSSAGPTASTTARDVEQHAAADDRRDGVDPQRREPGRRLHARRHLDVAVHAAVVGLMADRVDVRAGVLGHVDHRRRAGARLRRAALMAAVQRQHHPGSCAG